jgi:hypothetical protein
MGLRRRIGWTLNITGLARVPKWEGGLTRVSGDIAKEPLYHHITSAGAKPISAAHAARSRISLRAKLGSLQCDVLSH